MAFGKAGRLTTDETTEAGFRAAENLYSLRMSRTGLCRRGVPVLDEDTQLLEREILMFVNAEWTWSSSKNQGTERAALVSKRLNDLISPQQSTGAKCAAALVTRLMSSSAFRGCLNCVLRQAVRCV